MNGIHQLFQQHCVSYGKGQYGPKEGRSLNKPFLNDFASGSKVEKKTMKLSAPLSQQRRRVFGLIDADEPEADLPYHGLVLGGVYGRKETYVKLVNKRVDSRRAKGIPQLVQLYMFGKDVVRPAEKSKSRGRLTRWRLCDVTELKDAVYLTAIAWCAVALGMTPDDVQENVHFKFAVEQALAVLSLAATYKEAEDRDNHVRAAVKKQPQVARTLAGARRALASGVDCLRKGNVVTVDCSAYVQELEPEEDKPVDAAVPNKKRRRTLGGVKACLPPHLCDGVDGLDVVTCREYLTQAREDVSELKRARDFYARRARLLIRADMQTMANSEAELDDDAQEEEQDDSSSSDDD
jgi:hypothetical protein